MTKVKLIVIVDVPQADIDSLSKHCTNGSDVGVARDLVNSAFEGFEFPYKMEVKT